ncbi:histone acetyltransferase subunit NuA4-domain-containing protein [Zopfochytrium polystomum]|nr:histone acetyltransferase subunit NuA4-domain-containing protein [Zopfochytrium polystomum]
MAGPSHTETPTSPANSGPGPAASTHSSSSTAKPASTAEDTAKLLSKAEKDLMELMNRKKQADKALASIEAHLYTYEGSYLEDTQQLGNVVKGFEGFISNRADKRKLKFSENDRIFSQSSTTFLQSLDAKQREEQASEDDGRSSPSGKGDRFKKKRLGTPLVSSIKKKGREI